MKLLIGGHINPKYKVEIEIPQKSPVLSILFLIHISGVFLEIKSHLPQVICLSFMNDLEFEVVGNFVIDTRKSWKYHC